MNQDQIVDSVEIYLDSDNKVTKILADNIIPENLSTLCNDLQRCCGHSMSCVYKNGTLHHLLPTDTIMIDNISETHDFLVEQLGESVGDVSFCKDEHALLTQELLTILITISDRTTHQDLDVSTLIDYLDEFRWNGHCEGIDCNEILSINYARKHRTLLCPDCLKKTH